MGIGFIDRACDCDSEPIVQGDRYLSDNRDVPAADKHRGHRTDAWIESGGDAALDTADISLGGRDVLLAREEQRHVDRDAGEDRLLDSRNALPCPWNFPEEVGPGRLLR